MKNFCLISALLILLLSSEKTMAQKTGTTEYQTAIGIKVFPFALSLKTKVGVRGKNSIEFLGYFKDGFRLTGLYEFGGKLNTDGNLKWYLGFGGHAGFSDKSHGGDVKLGADGIIGLDYKFKNLPLNLSLDWQPALGIGEDNSFTNWGGLGVRFTL